MIYEYTIVTARPGTQPKAIEGLGRWLEGAKLQGSVAGAWYSEVGALNRVALLTTYEDAEQLLEDKDRIVRSTDPYGVGEFAASIDSSTFGALSFVGEPKTGDFGPWYEIRTYDVGIGRMQDNIERWENGYEARAAISPLLFALYSIGGQISRLVHIWPYRSIEERMTLRAKAVETGVWPPGRGAPTNNTAMQTDLYRPTPYSPLT